ncbi:MAG: single-stranded-DNA-specific exonuclease RecJ [Candidatus Omnitrophota bacterium]
MIILNQKKWQIRTPNPSIQVYLSNALGIHPIIAQLLINRGIEKASEAKNFLNGGEEQLHDPFLLKDMGKAIDRVKRAQQQGETVLIFGDYDVDGITASVVLRQVLSRFGISVINHIPNRMDDGYGLNDQILSIARQQHVSLVISVDCGITAIREAAILKENGIDLIIIDHHEPSEEGIPDALAVIDPKRNDCAYPFKDLAGVGLAAKFVQAMVGEIPSEILDLVALGTLADVVSLRGENRFFVKQGLPHIEATSNKGLQALLEISNIKGKKLKPYHAGFIIGPRINAAGRMGSASRALDLLLCDNEVEALRLARELDGVNTKRQQLQRKIVQEAMDMIEREVNFKDHRVIVLAKKGWHKGVLGIVASKVVEMFYRPAIIATLDNGIGIASARSIEGFHLHEALTHCSKTLEEFGGHRLAAGLTVQQDKIDLFRDQINAYALERLAVEDLVPFLEIDGQIPLSSLDTNLSEMIELLEPYGEGNAMPVFCSLDLTLKSRPAVLARDTLKFWVSDGATTLSAVGFGMGKYAQGLKMGSKVDLAYELSVDDWNKAPVVQLKLRDIRFKE